MPIFLRRHWFAILGLTVASTVAFFTYQPSPPTVTENRAAVPTTTLSTPPLTRDTTSTITPSPNFSPTRETTLESTATPSTTSVSPSPSNSEPMPAPYSPPATTSTRGETIPITIQIASTTYALDIAPESSVYDALEVLRNTASVPIQYKYFGQDLGYFVEAIDGIRNNPRAGMYWVYSINGTKATAGISTTIIQPHDYIHWTYEASYY